MESVEIPAMMAALVLTFGVVAAKVMITQLIGRMNRQISQVAQVKSQAMNRLKAVQSQKSVIDKNKAMLDKKKNKLSKKLSRLKKEMAEMQGDETARRARAEQRRVG